MSLERKAISALKWASAAKLVVQLASWAGTLIVVRLLTPQDYGLMAKVAVVCAIANSIAELGLEATIARFPTITREELQKLYAVSLLFGGGMTLLLIAASPLLAYLFREPRLELPIAAASLQILLSAMVIVPSAMWTRELAFRRLAKIEMVSGITIVALTAPLALAGFGVWALVLGSLGGAVVRSTALLMFGVRVWPRFSFRGIHEHLKFGFTLVGNRVSYFLVIQSDVLIGSAFLSTVEIGRYAVALQLATLPMAKVMGTINQIMLPAVARQQDDRARVRQSLLKSVAVISLGAFPAIWGISAVAPELVRVLFGPTWLEAVPALTILPLVVPIRMVCSVLFTTSLALGNRQLDLRNTIVNFIVLPLGFFVGAHWGMVGLCSAWLVSVPLAYSFSVSSVLRAIDVRALDVLKECGTPAFAAGVMYVAVTALRPVLAQQPAIVALLALVVAGAVVYVGTMALISWRHLVGARKFVRTFFAKDVPETV